MKTNASSAVSVVNSLFAYKHVRAYYKHAIKRVFIEGPDMECTSLVHSYIDLCSWEPSPIRQVNRHTFYFSIPVEQIHDGEDF